MKLKLFIKVPVSCKSSITILEGDFRNFNDTLYKPVVHADNSGQASQESGNTNTKITWEYKQNHTVLNFGDTRELNGRTFTPIGKLQLLAFNTGESYPFADRLIEYLSGSAITPLDEIPDNIKRVQEVMRKNGHYFKIAGLWEAKMQGILYDYIMNSGPVTVSKDNKKLIDKHVLMVTRSSVGMESLITQN